MSWIYVANLSEELRVLRHVAQITHLPDTRFLLLTLCLATRRFTSIIIHARSCNNEVLKAFHCIPGPGASISELGKLFTNIANTAPCPCSITPILRSIQTMEYMRDVYELSFENRWRSERDLWEGTWKHFSTAWCACPQLANTVIFTHIAPYNVLDTTGSLPSFQDGLYSAIPKLFTRSDVIYDSVLLSSCEHFIPSPIPLTYIFNILCSHHDISFR